jgi:circadian clock protein KaiC
VNLKKPTEQTFWSGVPALDHSILPRGLALRSLNVIGGGPGTGKTILALQMLFANASPENKAVYFTTISEPTIKFLAYLQAFDFYDAEKMFSSIVVRDIGDAIQNQPLPKVIETINQIAIDEVGAKMVIIDSFKAISDIVPQADQLRVFAYNLAVNLVSSMCTTFLVGEYTLADMAEVPIFAIADGIFRLSFQAEGLNRQRYLEVHKIRGRGFVSGLHPFDISSGGVTVSPRIRISEQVTYEDVTAKRISSGVPVLDEMLDGGLPSATATMVAGGAGTGKTLLGLHFIAAGAIKNEPGVIVTFQENPAQLRQIAASFGWDMRDMEERGLLVHLYHSPVEIQPDIHTARVKEAVAKVGAKRVFVDSLKDLEIATRDKVRYKDYVYSLVNEFKRQGVTILLTNEIPELFGDFSLSEFGVSFIADNVFLLRYVELDGKMGRAFNVLKVRGSQHSKEIRTFEITSQGIVMGPPIKAITGVLTGTPTIEQQPLARQEMTAMERYVMDVVRQIGPAPLADLQQETNLVAEVLETVLSDLTERGFVLGYGPAGAQKYKSTL